jgi:hypothetical protein
MKRIGLIAGNGKFPILVAKAALQRNIEVVAIGIRQETSSLLERYVARIYWVSVGQLGELFKILKGEKIKEAVMAGQIKHSLLFKNIQMDGELKRLLNSVEDKRTDTLLGAVAARLKSLGITLADSTDLVCEQLIPRGTLTEREPSLGQWRDIKFAKQIAERIAGLDIGQTVAVKDGAVLAVEAIEGTDEMIKRAGKLGKKGIVVVKVSKGSSQDMRFDVPVIGPRTIETLGKAGATVLAIEAGRTLVLEEDRCVKKANKCGISIVAI